MTQPVKPPAPLVHSRASILAPTQRALPTPGGVREFLAFVVGLESYALPLSSIQEIMKLPPVTEVPRGPRDVLGIISVRGRVTTVIDLRRRLNMMESPLSARARVLLVSSGEEVMGLLVDRVRQVYRLHDDEVEIASVMGADTSDYVSGIGRPGRHGRGRQAVEDGASKGKRGKPSGGGGKAGASESGRKASKMRAMDANEILVLLDPVELLSR